MTANMPTVAVITTLYRGDAPAFVEQGLASIFGQDYPAERIRVYLCIDGPLPPALTTVLDRWRDRLQLILRNEQNIGLPESLNRLLDRLGDESYVLRMDLDDICVPNRFTRQVEYMQMHTDIDLCGSNCIEIDECGQAICPRDFPEMHEQIFRSAPIFNPILHPTMCYRASSLTPDRVRYREAYLNEDLQMVFDLMERGWRFHNLQEPLLHRRVVDDFFRRRNFKRAWVELTVYTRGTWNNFGLTPAYSYSAARFVLRLLPTAIVKRAYRSALRHRLFKRDGPGKT